MPKNSQGIALPIILVAVTLLLGASIAGFIYFQKSQSTPNNNGALSVDPTPASTDLSSPESSSTSSLKTIAKVTPKPSGSVALKTVCSNVNTVCLDSGDLTVSLQQGYLENSDKWVVSGPKVIGKSAVGFKVKIEGFRGGITIDPVIDALEAGTTQTIEIRIQKDVVPLGTYTGKLTLTPDNAPAEVINLTINYVAWEDSAVHVVPAKIGMTVTKNLKTGERTWKGDEPLKLYYYKKHHVQLKGVAEKGGANGLIAKFQYGTEDEAVIDTAFIDATLNNDIDKYIEGEYTGYIQVSDFDSKKELTRIPYQLIINSE